GEDASRGALLRPNRRFYRGERGRQAGRAAVAATGDPMKIGALDVGTNTVQMLVAETTPDGGARRVTDLARVTRLGLGVDHNHRLDPAAALGTLDTIAEF